MIMCQRSTAMAPVRPPRQLGLARSKGRAGGLDCSPWAGTIVYTAVDTGHRLTRLLMLLIRATGTGRKDAVCPNVKRFDGKVVVRAAWVVQRQLLGAS